MCGSADKRIRLFLNSPQNKEVIQPELNLFAVQMVSRPLYFAIHINLSDALVLLWKKACKILNKILYVGKAIAREEWNPVALCIKSAYSRDRI